VWRNLVWIFLAILIAWLAMVLLIRPSNDRDWAPDQTVLPWAEFDGPNVTVHGIRNFTYRSESEYQPAWYERTFDLRELESAWFIVEPFGEFEGSAHTFVSFGFRNGDYVAVSVEIRKEKGETFSSLKGLLRQYELTYVVGDERDLVKLRSNFRNDQVYVYPVKATPEGKRRMFVEMLRRANSLRARPEFYNTLTNTCTTNLMRHVNAITPKRIPLRMEVLLPGYSDRFAYELGLIDTDLSFEDARGRFHINEKARVFAEDPEFSRKIREP